MEVGLVPHRAFFQLPNASQSDKKAVPQPWVPSQVGDGMNSKKVSSQAGAVKELWPREKLSKFVTLSK